MLSDSDVDERISACDEGPFITSVTYTGFVAGAVSANPAESGWHLSSLCFHGVNNGLMAGNVTLQISARGGLRTLDLRITQVRGVTSAPRVMTGRYRMSRETL